MHTLRMHLLMVRTRRFAGDHRSYEAQMRHFSRKYRVVAYNARGYPPSDVRVLIHVAVPRPPFLRIWRVVHIDTLRLMCVRSVLCPIPPVYGVRTWRVVYMDTLRLMCVCSRYCVPNG